MRPLALVCGGLTLASAAMVACADDAAGSDPFPQAAAAYVLLTDGRELWSRKPDAQLPPASLTKIMTALLALESGHDLEEISVISRQAAAETGTRIGLKAGEHMRLKALLAAALLQSANDACHAIAEFIAGSEPAFVALMNKRAKTLGLASTHFTNACGHDGARHYSSARDLAVLAQAAMQHARFAGLVSRVWLTVRTEQGREFRLENKNQLIGRYRGAVGIKSGTTTAAGLCIVALARRDGAEALLVLLNAQERWWTAEAMLDRAFAEMAPATRP